MKTLRCIDSIIPYFMINFVVLKFVVTGYYQEFLKINFPRFNKKHWLDFVMDLNGWILIESST